MEDDLVKMEDDLQMMEDILEVMEDDLEAMLCLRGVGPASNVGEVTNALLTDLQC